MPDDKSIAWHRDHHGQDGHTYTTMSSWVLGRWESRVWSKSEDGEKFPTAVGCASADEAKTRSEELLQEQVAHDCGAMKCGSWTAVANVGEVG